MSEVKLSMQFGNSAFTAEGSEEFVKSMLSHWESLSADKAHAITPTLPTTGMAVDTLEHKEATALSKFENVYDEIDGKLKIIANISGPNKAAKTRNTALVLLYGNYLLGEETTSSDTIREACIDQGCFDSSNFSSHLKGLKEKVAMNTKGSGDYEVKLTAPGRKYSLELVENINKSFN